MMNVFQTIAVAFAMFSAIPCPQPVWTEKNMRYSLCAFPLIGVVCGLLWWGWAALMAYVGAPTLLLAGGMCAIPVLVTGGIHLDGYADTTDALSSYGEKEKKLEILKDPHTGAFAVIGLCVYFLADTALWSEVTAEVLPVVSCMYVISRSLSGISVVSFQAAKNSGLLKTFQDGAQRLRVRIVLIFWLCACAALMLFLSWQQAVGALLAAAAVFIYYYKMSMKQFGGTTGDLAGYFLQVCELAMLAGILLGGLAGGTVML